MPELPEVEVLRRFFEESAVHKDIANTAYYDDLNRIFKSSREEIDTNLIDNQFSATKRLGKYLFAKISNGHWLHLHFGMTGSLEVFTDDASRPKFTRFEIGFKDGSKLAFRDMRKFGSVEIVKDLEGYVNHHKIGEDFLQIQGSAFIKALTNRKSPIKAALLDQHYFAGIGNWIADEMLFETAIHPETLSSKLTDEELQKLYLSGQRICKLAIDHDTHYGNFPSDFFVNYRKAKAIHPVHPNSPIEKLKVGGRGTFIVPERQKIRK